MKMLFALIVALFCAPLAHTTPGNGAVCTHTPPSEVQRIDPQPTTVETPFVHLSLDYPELPGTTLALGVDPTAPSMSTTWTTQAGFEQNVTTPRKTGEGKNNQAKRHHMAVKALANEMGGPAITPVSPTTTKLSPESSWPCAACPGHLHEAPLPARPHQFLRAA